MSAKFYTLLTDIGAAKLASAAALGVPQAISTGDPALLLRLAGAGAAAL